jgi:hypothetical protein
MLKGEFVSEKKSSDARYSVPSYVSNGGAITDFAVRCELIDHERNDKKKNIN